MADETIAFTFHGTWDEGAGGYQEFFGGDDGLPCHDLTSADVAGFNGAQREKLSSPAGQRLYRPVKAVKSGKSATDAEAG